ncbi:hypothetical protein C5O80_08165 [Burkholderia sp. SRS-46]|nr:hypothetical protein C5O80_08165 [Burkholderia sp. SRS-46]
MTSVNRPSIHSPRHPKPTWGPGKNAALSFVAFAVIFGLFAYVERDTRDERGSAIHEASGVVAQSLSKTDRYPAAANVGPDIASAGSTAPAAAPPAMTSPVTVEIEPEAAPAVGPVNGKYAEAHRAHQHAKPHEVASARKHVTVASRPHAYGAGAAHMKATSVTHQELEGARALSRARLCAQLDDWGCVEQNASRALAIDPQNSESRALLGRAVRNRS